MMSTSCYAIAVHLIASAFATDDLYDNWRVGSATLPTPPAVIGYANDTNTLYFLGGINTYNAKQLSSYDITSETVQDLGVTSLTRDVYVGAQSYAQIGSVVYIADDWFIDTFDVYTKVMQTSVLSLDDVTARSCFVNIDDRYLGVLLETAAVKLYDTLNNNWLSSSNSPIDTNIGRYDASCVYINDYLYIIGGQNQLGFVYDDMEYIHIKAVINGEVEETWSSKVLPQGMADTRLVAIDERDIILIMGGTDGSSVFNTVYGFDTVSKEITTVGTLAKSVYSQSVVFIDDVILSFGGYNGRGDTTPWTGLQSNPLYPSVETTSSNDDNGGADTTDKKGSNTATVVIKVIVVIIVVLLAVFAVFFYMRYKKKSGVEAGHYDKL